MRPHILLFAILGFLALGALWLALAWGSTGFSWTIGLSSSDPAYWWPVRWPRTFLAFGIGSVLAVSGTALQGLSRNPLVSPFTLGVSSGAALGAVIGLRFGIDSGFSLFIAALTTGLGTAGMLFLLSGLSGKGGIDRLLLAGITLSFFSSACILFIQYTSTYVEAFKMVRWLMGGLDFVTFTDVLMFVIPALFVVLLLASIGSHLNLMMLGDLTASSCGVHVPRLTVRIVAATSIGVAASVATAGPIAFVGILVPHMLRLCGVQDYRLLVPASLLAGGTFLTLCDLLARVLLAPAQLPVGVITSMLGGPFFLHLLLHSRHFSDSGDRE